MCYLVMRPKQAQQVRVVLSFRELFPVFWCIFSSFPFVEAYTADLVVWGSRLGLGMFRAHLDLGWV